MLFGSLVANRMTSVLFVGCVAVGFARSKTCKAHKSMLVTPDLNDKASWREPLASAAGLGRI